MIVTAAPAAARRRAVARPRPLAPPVTRAEAPVRSMCSPSNVPRRSHPTLRGTRVSPRTSRGRVRRRPARRGRQRTSASRPCSNAGDSRLDDRPVGRRISGASRHVRCRALCTTPSRPSRIAARRTWGCTCRSPLEPVAVPDAGARARPRSRLEPVWRQRDRRARRSAPTTSATSSSARATPRSSLRGRGASGSSGRAATSACRTCSRPGGDDDARVARDRGRSRARAPSRRAGSPSRRPPSARSARALRALHERAPRRRVPVRVERGLALANAREPRHPRARRPARAAAGRPARGVPRATPAARTR